jgi:carboxypeptidase C (cathepsin A)
MLFLNGGPGASSQFGNLLENGPMRIINGKFVPAKDNWADDYNVIYLD